jgi:hypothetical protein
MEFTIAHHLPNTWLLDLLNTLAVSSIAIDNAEQSKILQLNSGSVSGITKKLWRAGHGRWNCAILNRRAFVRVANIALQLGYKSGCVQEKLVHIYSGACCMCGRSGTRTDPHKAGPLTDEEWN